MLEERHSGFGLEKTTVGATLIVAADGKEDAST